MPVNSPPFCELVPASAEYGRVVLRSVDYHQKNGWLWQVISGGWIDLEATREKFWLKSIHEGSIQEYLIANDQSVFLLTNFPPELIAVEADM